MEETAVSQKPFRILSIDGGGLRGLIVVQILQWIEANILGKGVNGQPNSITDSFDLFAGTSTGGLIACALTAADRNTGESLFSLEEINDMYMGSAKTIFPCSRTKMGEAYEWVKNKVGPKYSPEGLKKVLEPKLRGKRILDCRKNIFIPTYNVSRFKPVYFTSRQAKIAAGGPDGNAPRFNSKLTDICLATSAAPTYFPSHEFEYSDESGFNETLNCVDGGVYLNNPALAAYLEVLSHPLYYTGEKEIDKKNVFVLSIGTGKVAKNITKENGASWGEVKWAKNVIDAAMQGTSQTIEEHLKSLLPRGNYVRINIDVAAKFSGLDDSSAATTIHLMEQVQQEFVNNQAYTSQLLAFKNLANL